MAYGLQYIQLLKSPPRCVAMSQSFKVVLTITNDLTDEKCYNEIVLECKVYDGNGQEFNGLRLNDGSNNITYTPFNGGFCSFVASLTRLPPCGTDTVRLKVQAVSAPGPSHTDDVDSIMAMIGSKSLILPVWTTDIRVIQRAKAIPVSDNQQQSERRLQVSSEQLVRILEDKQESIARHLWYNNMIVCNLV
ncbi:hypothetical protein BGW37DRAFT_233966 [Umbelopsis sp. PMI_123]|nr:hypothetical protein BGW37DRAFT_233966 [Umbelopsis sp. PMI_123]